MSSFGDEVRNNYLDNLLIDCNATAHIIRDKKMFTDFYEKLDGKPNIIELADGTRKTGAIVGKGNAEITIHDSEGITRKFTLYKVLGIPSYKQDILSVHAISEHGSHMSILKKIMLRLKPPVAQLVFNLVQKGKVYFLNNVSIAQHRSRSLI